MHTNNSKSKINRFIVKGAWDLTYIHSCIAVNTHWQMCKICIHTSTLTYFLGLTYCNQPISSANSIIQHYLGSNGSRGHPGSLRIIRVQWPGISLGARRCLVLPQPIERFLSPLNCGCSHRLLILPCFGPILKRWVELINREVAGRISTRDLSTIQQFEALHLSAERGGLCRWPGAWTSESAWVYVGRDRFDPLNVFT